MVSLETVDAGGCGEEHTVAGGQVMPKAVEGEVGVDLKRSIGGNGRRRWLRRMSKDRPG